MILITGGTGLLGSYIIKELQKQNLEVPALVRPESLNKLESLKVDIAAGDLSNHCIVDILRHSNFIPQYCSRAMMSQDV